MTMAHIAKRAETRPCPACAESIPVRLLAAHAALEMQRVEDTIGHIGEAEVLAEVDDLEEGCVCLSTTSRNGRLIILLTARATVPGAQH
jgi:hypothetical protein